MVRHRLPHVAHAGLAHGGRAVDTHSPGCRWHTRGRVWGWQMRLRVRNLLAVVDLRHASYPAASEAGVLVAVPPAVDCSLDQASLATQRRVELRQGPTNPVAIGLVHEAISTVRILGAACPGIHAVLLLEVRGQLIGVDRLHVASDGVFHLDSVPRVLKSNPLDAIAILPHHQGCSGRNRTRSSVRVAASSPITRTLKLRGAILGVLL